MFAKQRQKSSLSCLNLKGGIPMRNLKRALSLGLTAAMISGLMVMGSSPA